MGKKISHISLNLDTITDEQYHLLMEATYFKLMTKVKMPASILDLKKKQKRFNSSFQKKLDKLPLHYSQLLSSLNKQNLDTFVGVLERIAHQATVCQAKLKIKEEHLKSYHLFSSQIHQIIDNSLLNQALVEELERLVKAKKSIT